MIRRFVLTFLGFACSVAIASAQAKPDFSGRWTTDPEPAATAPAGGGAGAAGVGAPGARGAGGGRAAGAGPGRGGGRGDMGSGWGPTITLTQTGGSLTVEYAFFSRGDMQPPLKFAYALDGSESKNSVMMGRGIQYQVSKTSWDGGRLIITSQHTFAGPDDKPITAELKQTLTLESPTSLVVETVRGGVLGGQPTTARTVYRKF